eukprot:TRINITY_DN5161_c0_g1_i1.p1 TRINITY_DN5161_c0_g1~~TRINITY_DN5161_c0_g1_i1.p1  ORF type:complete len:623 (-),score=166.62 TRINITY_DN5161_c0_g1_i1:111-1979(-)
MLDTSQCQKPERRMNFRGIRASKFRHVYGLPAKKEKCYENVRISRNAHDSNYCAANPKFLAVVVEVGGGGSFLVLPLEKCGRIEHNSWKVAGHAGPVLDIKWNPFNDNIIASASEDCLIKLWYIPDGGIASDLKESLIQLTGHRRRVGIIEWHPTAENILVSASYDHTIIVWNIARGVPVNSINCHTDTIYSMSFNRNGSLLATTCKDKKLRVLDPRTGEIVQQGDSHQGTKAAKVTYLGEHGLLFTTGFSKFSDRQFAVWSETDLSQPLKIETIDSSSGILIPTYDPDTSMVYVAGKGDGNVRYYEVINEAPWACYLSQFISGAPQKGFGILPKRGVDVLSCEVFRMYKLHATKDLVEPISMIVPRKSDTFQDDIYPETAAPIAAISADDWLAGKNASPVLISMKTGSKTRTYKPVMYKPSEQAIVVSDRNNDRKFMFLSEETKPDYRPKEQRTESRPSPAIDHRPYGADKYQTKESEYRPKKMNDMPDAASEKDIKTSLNLGTKFQQVQKKWSGGSLGSPCLELDLDQIYKNTIPSGSSSVRSLTSRFDYKDNKETEETEIELKRVVNDQFKQISNLRSQVESKERKIYDLESTIKVLTRNNTPVGTPVTPKDLLGKSFA